MVGVCIRSMYQTGFVLFKFNVDGCRWKRNRAGYKYIYIGRTDRETSGCHRMLH